MQAIAQRILLELRLFFTAMQFLTRMRVPAWVGFEPIWLQRCVRYFPLAGAMVGCFGALVLALASRWWPPGVAAVLSMVATVWMTGGFHEDGWADTCDGLGGSVSRERALEIMKDSRVGVYASLGLILILMLKATVLTDLLSPLHLEPSSSQGGQVHQVLLGWTVMGMIWAQALSRAVPVALIKVLRYAGDVAHAKAKPLATRVSNAGAGGTAVVSLAVAVMLWLALNHFRWPQSLWWRAMAGSVVAALLVTGGMAQWLTRRLGGYTGDTLGASQQLSEVVILLVWLAVI